MNILMVLTSHDTLGSTGCKTGFWLEEFAAPYYVFKDAGASLTLASPLGGQPPLYPKSDEADAQTDATRRLKADDAAQAVLARTLKLSEVKAASFDAVFYPGGHGPLWDLAEDRHSAALIEALHAAGKPVAAVCHAPAVLRHTKAADGSPLVQGKTGTNGAKAIQAARTTSQTSGKRSSQPSMSCLRSGRPASQAGQRESQQRGEPTAGNGQAQQVGPVHPVAHVGKGRAAHRGQGQEGEDGHRGAHGQRGQHGVTAQAAARHKQQDQPPSHTDGDVGPQGKRDLVGDVQREPDFIHGVDVPVGGVRRGP